MSYYSQWQTILNDAGNTTEAEEEIKKYYQMETAAYEMILESAQENISGTAAELADKLGFGQDMTIFLGFLDGINSSLRTAIDLDSVENSTEIALDIDYRKLFWNMHEAKADWLYGLKAWNQVLTAEEQTELTKGYRTSKIIRHEKIGRNDPCPCGSGKKYKNCCGKGA